MKRKIVTSRSKKWSFRYSMPILIVISGLLIASIFRNITTIQKAKIEVQKKEAELQKLESKSIELKKQEETIGSDFYKEVQLRDKLGYGKEGEIVVVLPDEATLRKLAPELPAEEIESEEANWRKWLNLFF